MNAQVKVVYVGRARLTDGKLSGLFATEEQVEAATDGDGLRSVASTFVMKERDLPAVVGGSYYASGLIENGQVKRLAIGRAHIRYDDRLASGELLAQLSARDEAERVAFRALKLEKEMMADKELLTTMKSLRGQYTATDRIGRLALEVVVLAALRHA